MARPGLAALARALGGDAWDGGRRAVIPGPGHSPADRSVSLLLREGRVIVHSFAGDDWRVVRAALRAAGWIDGDGRLLGSGSPAPGLSLPPSTRERIDAAAALWSGGSPIRHGPVRRYLVRRGIHRDAGAALRSHGAVPAAIYAVRGRRRPALLAAISAPDGALCGVEVTLLDDSGAPAGVTPRRTIGIVPAGSAVRLDPACAALLVGEGVLTCLSASARFRRPAWALLSAGNLRRWNPPAGVKDVLIAADGDPTGLESAARLAGRLRALGLRVRVEAPPSPASDWNETDGTARRAYRS